MSVAVAAGHYHFSLPFSVSSSRNILADADRDFLKHCTFDNRTDVGKTCPIFTLGQIVGMINGNESYYDELATQVMRVGGA